MKKISKIAVLSVLLILKTTSIHAQNTFQPNDQKIWSVDSEVHTFLNMLYLNEGYSLPSSTGPWSNAELKMWLYNIDSENLSESSKILYQKIEDILCKQPRFILDDTLGFNVQNILNPEFYIHTNPEEFSHEKDWEYDFEKRQPLFESDIECFAASHFYTFINTPINWGSYIVNPDEPDRLYQPVFMSNIPYAPNRSITDISVNFPTKAFASFGYNHWNFNFGRNVIRWGNGATGNLTVGGNQIYDNYMQYSLFYPKFKYTFLTDFYPHDENIYSSEEKHGQNEALDGLKFFMIHKIEGRFINNRLTASIAEGIMYQSATNKIDVGIFNPVGFFHNYYIRGNANSILNIDADFAITNGVNLYTQIILDDLAFIGESNASSDEPWRPSKMGCMLGTKYQMDFLNGVLNLNAEAVYTDPCTYLREEYDSASKTQGVSFYGHYREFLNGYSNEINYIRNCTGYRYGGDCISADLRTVYDSLDKLKVNLDFFYLAHGIMYNPFISDGDWFHKQAAKTPSKEDLTNNHENSSDKTNNPSGEVAHLFRASIGASYDILPQFTVNGAIDNCFIWNKDNKKKNMVYDLQLHLGAKYVFLK